MRLSASCWCLALALALSCQVSWAANIARPKSMYDVINSKGLYSSADKVAILDASNFDATISGTDVAWLIEFYSASCGHCQAFAPTWKEFAADVAGWSRAVRIGVINCDLEANTPVCRNYSIMAYPSIRYFESHHHSDDTGAKFDKGGVADMRRSLLIRLESDQISGKGSSWPNITPYRSSDLHNLWKGVPSSVLYSILIFKDKENVVGTDLVLDFSRIPSIQLRTVSADNEALSKLMQVSSFPSVVVVKRGSETGKLLYTQDTSHIGLKIAIEAFLKSENIELVKVETNPEEVIENEDTAADDAELQRQVKQLMSQKGDVAFLADLEHALRFSLRHEVSLRKHMTGPVLKALQNYLLVIQRNFPLSETGVLLLNSLSRHVDSVTELSGEDWQKLLTAEEAKLAAPAWTEQNEFLGCRGSQPNLRGYPCSLWTTFHVLTVHAFDSNTGQPRDVLDAILGYVTHFFGCGECSKHFQEMASETMFSVTSYKDSVIWLWEAHNKVNKRLAGAITEDPAFPKIQFPSIDRCPACRDSEEWVKHEVLQYMQSVYSHGSLSAIAAAKSNNVMNRHLPAISSGSKLNTFDMSLYVLLYLTSAAIIALVCLKFLLPRTYHKKIYVHDIFGKV